MAASTHARRHIGLGGERKVGEARFVQIFAESASIMTFSLRNSSFRAVEERLAVSIAYSHRL